MSDSIPNIPHAEICIPFTVNGEKFEAVGFLKVEEGSVYSLKAFDRADNGHLVRSSEDWRMIYDHRDQLPAELQRYWLATARPSPGNPLCVSVFNFSSDGWEDDWINLESGWNQCSLVVRRVA